MLELLDSGPLGTFNPTTSRTAEVPLVIGPKIYVTPENLEDVTAFLALKASIAVMRIFVRRLMSPGMWTGGKDIKDIVAIGRGAYDRTLDGKGLAPREAVIDHIVNGDEGFEFLCDNAVLFAKPGAIEIERDIEVVFDKDRGEAQANVWFKLTVDWAKGRLETR